MYKVMKTINQSIKVICNDICL